MDAVQVRLRALLERVELTAPEQQYVDSLLYQLHLLAPAWLRFEARPRLRVYLPATPPILELRIVQPPLSDRYGTAVMIYSFPGSADIEFIPSEARSHDVDLERSDSLDTRKLAGIIVPLVLRHISGPEEKTRTRRPRGGDLGEAQHRRDKCMERGCDRPPEIECRWCEGRARAWFCRAHFDAWVKADELHEPDYQREVQGGKVGKEYGEDPVSECARFRELTELAAATATEQARDYYHGTPQEPKAQAIMQAGEIRPGATVQGRSYLAPVAGRVYLTPSLEYAIIYALGGVYAGRSPPPVTRQQGSRYGYVFVVPGSELGDIQPDEDSVGELAAALWTTPDEKDAFGHKWDQTEVPWFIQSRLSYPGFLSNQVRRGLQGGELAYQALVGKKLLKVLSQEEKRRLLDMGMHVAQQGAIRPREAWRVDKTRSLELAADGSNFFQVAEQVWTAGGGG